MKELTSSSFVDDFVFLEGPRWNDGKLWVSDMFGNTVYTITPDGERLWPRYPIVLPVLTLCPMALWLWSLWPTAS